MSSLKEESRYLALRQINKGYLALRSSYSLGDLGPGAYGAEVFEEEYESCTARIVFWWYTSID